MSTRHTKIHFHQNLSHRRQGLELGSEGRKEMVFGGVGGGGGGLNQGYRVKVRNTIFV